MSEPSNAAYRNPPQPDQTETPAQHDQEGRTAGPYAPPGRDARGNPIPSVPHEGLLGRLGVSLLLGQSVVLAAVGVAGLVTSWGAGFGEQVQNTVLALRLNPAHSVLLLVTAVVGAVCTTKRRRLRTYAGVQAICYVILFVFGSAKSVNTGSATVLALNTPDNVLHAVLAILGFIVLIIASARVVEPPPASLPYPGAVPRPDGQDPPADAPTPWNPERKRASEDEQDRTRGEGSRR